ncbi:MAG: ion channel, partial [Candidatus Subteraquimicrobiales bacterium]|nr:ion channel [Candidatus Subteraquimicrobiales bacterium]
MSILKRLLFVLTLMGLVISAGIVGYMFIERWPFIDALYMTVITISTVGFREVAPLSSVGRIFTIFLIL